MNLNVFLVFAASCITGWLTQADDAATASTNKQNVCTSEACSKAARFLLNNLDKSVNPCDDFYEFACGNFVKTSEPHETRFSRNLEDVWKFLKVSLREESSSDEPETFKKLKYYYRNCQDNEEQENKHDFLKFLRKYGGWPLLDGNSWTNSSFNWMSVINLIPEVPQESGNGQHSAAMKFKIKPNRYNRHMPKILSSNKTEIYLKFMTSVAEALKANSTNVSQEVAQVLDLEVKLNEIIQANNSESKVVTLGQLKSDLPKVNWTKIVPNLQDSNEIFFYNFSSVEKFYRLLMSTPDRVWSNYVSWTLFLNHRDIFSKPLGYNLEKMKDDFVYEVTGVRLDSTSSKCIILTSFNMILALNVFVIRKHFDTRKKEYLRNLVDDIRGSFGQVLNSSHWMDQNSKEQLIQRLGKIKVIEPYSDEFLTNDTLIDSYYKELKIGSDDFFNKSESLNELIKSYGTEDISFPINSYTFFYTTGVYETNKNRTEERIIIPLWMLVESNLVVDVPNYLNYGMLGFLLGHEFGHGFDYNYHKSLGSAVEFLNRTRCIQDQYSNFSIKGSTTKFNGTRTSAEDVADNIGTKVVHNAYQTRQMKNGVESGLPGLDGYTPNQIFWMSYASYFCQKIPEDMWIDEVEFSEYTTNAFRVRGSLANSPEFARDFDCPVGSNMNPAKKCYLY